MDNQQYEWNLKELFENENELENAINELYQLIENIKKFKGRLNESVDEILGCYTNLEKALEFTEYLGLPQI